MKNEEKDRSNPLKAYNDEIHGRRGWDFFDSEEESEARDQAKIEKAKHGRGQKMDTVPPDSTKGVSGQDPDREVEEKE